MYGENYQIVQKAHRLRIGSAGQLPDGLEELLRTKDFVGVEAAVEPDDRLALRRQRPSLGLAHPLGKRQAPCDVLESVEALMVGRRRENRHQLRPAFRR